MLRPDGTGCVHLSPRTLAILGLSATGMASSDVAAALGLSREDVRREFTHAIVVLGARFKLEAIIIAYRRGLIELPSA